MTDSPVILVVDDSPIQRKIVAATLKANGYDVIVGTNGLEGINLALESQPDLILMDISMPELDGLAAVYELRRYPEMAHVPILALTAVTDPSELEEAYEAGYNDVVDKNADRGKLIEQVQAWLSG